jgi:S-adenosyl methyltransferase
VCRRMSDNQPNWIPTSVDLERPNAARVYDYLLGGACNFEPDREFAEKLLATIPEAKGVARLNRAFLGRSVRFCVSRGIRQFLDIGSGIPTVGNVHEIAQREVPDCRVVYIDAEAVAVAHSKLILEDNAYAGAAQANLLDVDGVLGAAPVRELLDFDQPVAVLMAAVLHFVPDSANPAAAVTRYVETMAPGSYLVVSHAAKVDLQRSRDGWKMYNDTSTPGGGRSREEIAALMAGTELVEPGVVWLSEWRPEPFDDVTAPEKSLGFAAVGYKP